MRHLPGRSAVLWLPVVWRRRSERCARGGSECHKLPEESDVWAQLLSLRHLLQPTEHRRPPLCYVPHGLQKRPCLRGNQVGDAESRGPIHPGYAVHQHRHAGVLLQEREDRGGVRLHQVVVRRVHCAEVQRRQRRGVQVLWGRVLAGAAVHDGGDAVLPQQRIVAGMIHIPEVQARRQDLGQLVERSLPAKLGRDHAEALFQRCSLLPRRHGAAVRSDATQGLRR
mmetsp:Transcript_8145/g.24757  ORF Transcript_8145/g.24757 Transcript_8145/m.24757 type:complete len:225 (+) Transcript_8145:23-697(+)